MSNKDQGIAAGLIVADAKDNNDNSILKAGALQDAILSSANFSSIATDEHGVIQIFNVGAEHMLGYSAAVVVNKITPADISDPDEIVTRAKDLSLEFGTEIKPGFEALVFKASRGIEDIYELTYVRKDGSRLPAVVSVTALRDVQGEIIGYLLIGTDNTARKEFEAGQHKQAVIQQQMNARLLQANANLQASEEKLAITLNSIGDAVLTTNDKAEVMLLNPVAEKLTGWSQSQAIGLPVDKIFHVVNKMTRQRSAIPVLVTLANGAVQGMANHTVLIARDGSERDIADSCAPIRDHDSKVIGAVLVFRDVTTEYAAQRALRDSSALIQAILNTVGEGILTCDAGTAIIETFNPSIERMFGFEATELIGQNLSLLIPEFAQEPGAILNPIEGYFAVGNGREVTGRRKDASTFPVEMAFSEMWLRGQRHFTGVLRDITAQKQAEKALLKAGALQNAIFNSANFSCIATDAMGVIQIFNVGAERMLGYCAAEMVNKKAPSEISDPQEIVTRANALTLEFDTNIKPGFEAMVFKAARGIGDIYELTYIRKDGSHFPAVVSVTALRDTNNLIIGYLLIGTDNTVRKQEEAERTQVEIELKMAKAAAEKANLAKSEFLSGMSHELRTPLSAILGFAQLMESSSPSPTVLQKRSIDQILKAGWYLLDLINEILDLTLVESGKLSMSMEPVSLAKVMRECQAMIEPQAQKQGIKVSFTPLEALWFIHADHTRVKQIMVNLLSNAIKYNKPAGTVVVSCVNLAPERIRICVEDTGDGMTPAQIGQLFQPFNRLGQELTSVEGTGIGLVMTKRLAELMGGVLGVESVAGKGSVFWLEMKLTLPPKYAVAVSAVPAVVHSDKADSRQRTLLYVEDNPANLMLVEDLMSRRPDIRLISARDGLAGIEMARAALPDVILMDINLPGINGIQVLELLSASSATAHIPVVALSANAMPHDIERGLAAGFFRYLTKPIKLNEFMDALDLAMQAAQTKPAA